MPTKQRYLIGIHLYSFYCVSISIHLLVHIHIYLALDIGIFQPRSTGIPNMATAAKKSSQPPLLVGWVLFLLAFSAGIIMLGGMSASQKFCGRAGVSTNPLVFQAGYFANVPCPSLYSFAWYITWYQIVMSVVIAIVLSVGNVHIWRYGLVGLLAPLLYLMMATANSFLLASRNLTEYQGAARAVLAGAIIGCVADGGLLAVFGVRDEDYLMTN